MKTYCYNEYSWNTAYLKSINHTILNHTFSAKACFNYIMETMVDYEIYQEFLFGTALLILSNVLYLLVNVHWSYN